MRHDRSEGPFPFFGDFDQRAVRFGVNTQRLSLNSPAIRNRIVTVRPGRPNHVGGRQDVTALADHDAAAFNVCADLNADGAGQDFSAIRRIVASMGARSSVWRRDADKRRQQFILISDPNQDRRQHDHTHT